MTLIRTCRYAWLPLVLLACLTSPAADAQPAADESRIRLLEAKPRAYAVIESAGSSDQARVRLVAIEAAEHAPEAAYDLAMRGLVDENPAVRFAALVTIGKLRIDRLADAAIDLMRDDNDSVRAAAIFAARRCGRDIDPTPLAQMLASDSPSARANAALLLGEMGEPQAIGMLREMAARPMPRVGSDQRAWVRLQFAEAIIKLDPDDAEALGSIRSAMYSDLDGLRVLAIQIIGDVGDRSVQRGLVHIITRDNPVQVRIAAATALAKMNDRRGDDTLLTGSRYDEQALRRDLAAFLRQIPDDTDPQAQAIREILDDPALSRQAAAEVRAQAAVGLGWARGPAVAERLGELLDDPEPVVRVAAASAVLRASR